MAPPDAVETNAPASTEPSQSDPHVQIADIGTAEKSGILTPSGAEGWELDNGMSSEAYPEA
jgi:hypothetical protein